MHIHILGICGTFMGGLASLGKELGHRVTGSDANVYPPMSTYLQTLGIELSEGFDAAALKPAPDLVIVGNALSRGNAAIEYMLNAEIPYTSGPAWLAANVLRGRHVMAVAGTHGKTTTTSLLAWLLESAGLEPGFLVGGIPENFGVSARLGRGVPFVVEADEYDTAFFDKRSKFVHYGPRTLILNNLEFDHADIFPDLDAIKRQFHHLLRTVPGRGRIIWHGDDPALKEVLAMGCWSSLETFGQHESANWQAQPLAADASRYRLRSAGGVDITVESPLLGTHNMLNAMAAIAAAATLDVRVPQCAAAIATFRNAKRRLERLACVDGVAIYDDFAHHPTAIAATLGALRAHLGRRRIVAVIEPRSNTMRMGAHRHEITAACAHADRVLLYAPRDLAWDLAECTASLGSSRTVYGNVSDIVADLVENAARGDHIVIMTNGGFENLHRRLIAALEERAAVAD